MFKQNKGVKTESERSSQHEATSPAQAVRTPYFLVRKCSGPKAHSYVAEWESKDCMHKTVFSSSDSVTGDGFLHSWEWPSAQTMSIYKILFL